MPGEPQMDRPGSASGPPGPLGPPPPPGSAVASDPAAAPDPASGTRSAGNPAANSFALRAALHGLAGLLIILGISAPVDSGSVLWVNSAAWAALATLAALAQAAALLDPKDLNGHSWLIAAIATGTLVLIWTLIMLPQISTNMAFMVTLGTACAVGGVWLSPARPELR